MTQNPRRKATKHGGRREESRGTPQSPGAAHDPAPTASAAKLGREAEAKPPAKRHDAAPAARYEQAFASGRHDEMAAAWNELDPALRVAEAEALARMSAPVLVGLFTPALDDYEAASKYLDACNRHWGPHPGNPDLDKAPTPELAQAMLDALRRQKRARTKGLRLGEALADALRRDGRRLDRTMHRIAHDTAPLDALLHALTGEEQQRVLKAWPAVRASLASVCGALRAGAGNAAETPAKREEDRDENGFVVNPADPSAFVAAKTILADHALSGMTTHKHLRRVLDARRDSIRQWHPSHQRLMVHLGDWQAFRDRVTHTLDGWATPEEVEREKAAIAATKQRGK